MTVTVNAANPNGVLAEGETLTETEGGPAVLFDTGSPFPGPGPSDPPVPMTFDNMGTITVTKATPGFPDISYGIWNGASLGEKATSVSNHGDITVSGNFAIGIGNDEGDFVGNWGSVIVTGVGQATGISTGRTIENHGLVRATGDSATAVSVGGQFFSGVTSLLTNYGQIEAVASSATNAFTTAVSAASNAYIVNAAGATISAQAHIFNQFVSIGVVMSDGGALLNDGDILVEGFGGMLWGVFINNFAKGAVYDGENAPIPEVGFGTIINNGVISVGMDDFGFYQEVGILVDGGPATLAAPNIINHGEISADWAILGSFGKEWIVNDGVIRGNIGLGEGDDILDGQKGSIIGNVDLGGGNDTFNINDGDYQGVIQAGGGDDLVRTGFGAQEIHGGGGADTLYGGEDNDKLFGDLGNDVLRGGSGDDIYGVDDVGDLVFEGVNNGKDMVIASISWTLGVNFENLTLADNYLNIDATGNAYDNIIIGNEGDNILRGGLGADTMTGGRGADIYYVDNIGDKTIEDPYLNQVAAGLDTVRSTLSWKLAAGVDNLQLLGNDALNGTGNAADNRLTGNSAANVLKGGDGNDALVGGGGADTMYGGAGDDTYYVDQIGDRVLEADLPGRDTVNSTISYQLGATLENLTLTGTDDIDGRGNASDNMITGNSGNNKLYGGDGTDWLRGGAGDDVLRGGSGHDTLNGGAGADVFVFNTAFDGTYDAIQNFQPGQDKIYLDNDIFIGIGPAGAPLDPSKFVPGGISHTALDGDDRIVYAASGGLYYDPDGTGPADQILFAIPDPGVTLTASDFWVI